MDGFYFPLPRVPRSRAFPMAGPTRPPPDARRTVCRYYASGYCWRGDDCWFLHEDADEQASASSSASTSRHPLPARPVSSIEAALKETAEPPATGAGTEARRNPRQMAKARDQRSRTAKEGQPDSIPVPDEESTASPEAGPSSPRTSEDRPDCCICFETPSMYGLLEKCQHPFCLTCIRSWRVTKGKVPAQISAGTLRQCPACRVDSAFVLPNKAFLPNGPDKDRKVETLKRTWAKIPCKNLEKYGDCPFGYECFYKHADSDGHPVILHHSHAQWLLRPRRHRRDRSGPMGDADFHELAPYVFENLFGLSPDRARLAEQAFRESTQAGRTPDEALSPVEPARGRGPFAPRTYDFDPDDVDDYFEDELEGFEEDEGGEDFDVDGGHWLDEYELDYWEDLLSRELANPVVDRRSDRVAPTPGFLPASAALRHGAGAGGIAVLAGMSGLGSLLQPPHNPSESGPVTRTASADLDDLPPLERVDGRSDDDDESPPPTARYNPDSGCESEEEPSRRSRSRDRVPDNWDDLPPLEDVPDVASGIRARPTTSRAAPEVSHDDDSAWEDVDDEPTLPSLAFMRPRFHRSLYDSD